MKWKLKYIDAFNNMEKALRDIVPVMDQMNTLVGRMENDKQIASMCRATARTDQSHILGAIQA